MSATGDYASVASDVVGRPRPGPGRRPAACTSGQKVLDVAAGQWQRVDPGRRGWCRGRRQRPHAELLEAGRALAADRLAIAWEEGDAEALPYEDGSFDAVDLLPAARCSHRHHQEAADELVRVCRPDGRIGLLSGTPEGFIGQMFATMKPNAPPPPPGAQPPLWGSEEHVRSLLGDRVRDINATRRRLVVDNFKTPEDFRKYFKNVYGPTIVVYGFTPTTRQGRGSRPRPGCVGGALRGQRRSDGVGVPGGDGRSQRSRRGGSGSWQQGVQPSQPVGECG